jgi:hypothetical protein
MQLLDLPKLGSWFSQRGVGVRATLHHGQAAVAVREGLGSAPDSLFGPGRLGQRAGWVEGDGLAVGVDLAGSDLRNFGEDRS